MSSTTKKWLIFIILLVPLIPGGLCLAWLFNGWKLSSLIAINPFDGDRIIIFVAGVAPVIKADIASFTQANLIPGFIAAVLTALLPSKRSINLAIFGAIACGCGFLLYVVVGVTLRAEDAQTLGALLANELISSSMTSDAQQSQLNDLKTAVLGVYDSVRLVYIIVGGAFLGLPFQQLAGDDKK